MKRPVGMVGASDLCIDRRMMAKGGEDVEAPGRAAV